MLMAGIVAAVASMTGPALADDWVATKLRGTVLVHVDGDWRPLGRGDVVSDEQLVRTMRTGRVTLERGGEVVELSSETQIRIHDRAGRKYTTVLQDFGTVSVEADVRAVQHFSVKTPHLAAVVKGTRFTVTSGKRTAEVSVERGSVAVKDSDTRQSTVVVAGQSAGTAAGAPLTVAGTGVLPVVRNADGSPVDARKGGDAAARADGPSAKEADKVAREAARAEREETRAARWEGRGSDHPSNGNGNSGDGSGHGGNGNSGSSDSGSGNGNSGNGGGNGGGNSGGNGNGHGNNG